MVGHGDLSQVQRDRVVCPEHAAAALQGVLAQGAGRLQLAYCDPGIGQGRRRLQGDGVVVAELAAAALQGVLAQRAGRVHFTQPN